MLCGDAYQCSLLGDEPRFSVKLAISKSDYPIPQYAGVLSLTYSKCAFMASDFNYSGVETILCPIMSHF